MTCPRGVTLMRSALFCSFVTRSSSLFLHYGDSWGETLELEKRSKFRALKQLTDASGIVLGALYELSYGKLAILSSQTQEQSRFQQKSYYLISSSWEDWWSSQILPNLRAACESSWDWFNLDKNCRVSEFSERTLYRRVQESNFQIYQTMI